MSGDMAVNLTGTSTPPNAPIRPWTAQPQRAILPKSRTTSLMPEGASHMAKRCTNREKTTAPPDQKTARLTLTLDEQFKESTRLERAIREDLAGLGFEP